MAQAAQQELTAATGQASSNTEIVATTAGRGIYTDLTQLIDGVRKLHGKFNVCMPITQPDLIPEMYAVALRPVAIDTRVDGKGKPLGPDVYQDQRDRSKYGLTKIGLAKFAAAANISWHPAYTGRVDDQTEQWVRSYRACGVVLGLDGTPRYITAHKTIDLRATKWGEKRSTWDGKEKITKVVAEGGKDALGMSESALQQARQFIDEVCESKAMNRVLRNYAFVKGLYTRDELDKPFVISALVFTGHTEDPELRREVAKAMAERAMGSTAALFGPAPAANHLIEDLGRRTPPPAIGVAVADDDGDDTIEAEATDSSSADPNPSAPRRFIAKVTDVSSQSSPPESKRRWTLHTVTFDDGTKATTFDRKNAGIASDAYEHDHPVAVETKQGDFGLEIATIAFVKDGEE